MTELVILALAVALLAAAALLVVRRGAGRRRSAQGRRRGAFRHRRGCPTADAVVVWTPAPGGLEERRCNCRVETRRPPDVSAGVYLDSDGVTVREPRRVWKVPDRP